MPENGLNAAVEVLYGVSSLPILMAPILGIRQADIAVAAEQGAVNLIAQIAVRLSVARKRGNVESGFELIHEPPIENLGSLWKPRTPK